MQRPLRPTWSSPRGLLTAATAAALLLALLPWRATGWLQTPANLVGVLVAPVQAGLTTVLSPIAVPRPADPGGGLSPSQVEQLNLTNLQLDAENRRLRAQIEALQSGLKVAGSSDLGVPRVIATSLGLRGTLLQLRTDDLEPTRDGRSPIGAGSVVVLQGSWLIGKVTTPGRSIALAQLITDGGAAAEIKAVVRPMPGEVGSPPGASGPSPLGLGLRLRPDGKGHLTGAVYALDGPVTTPADSSLTPPLEVQPGMKVRLADPAWPRFAQMLIVGEITQVSSAANDRKQVVVRPMFNPRELASADFTILVNPPSSEQDAPPAPVRP